MPFSSVSVSVSVSVSDRLSASPLCDGGDTNHQRKSQKQKQGQNPVKVSKIKKKSGNRRGAVHTTYASASAGAARLGPSSVLSVGTVRQLIFPDSNISLDATADKGKDRGTERKTERNNAIEIVPAESSYSIDDDHVLRNLYIKS